MIPELTKALNKLANSIEAMGPAGGTDSDQMLAFVIALITALVAVVGRFAYGEFREHKIKKDKRILLAGLVGDEINYRWYGINRLNKADRPIIGQMLMRFFSENKEFDLDLVERFKDLRISSEDLPIMKKVYDEAFDLNVFSDRSLISDLIYTHVCLLDFCDAHKRIVVVYKEHQNQKERELPPEEEQKRQTDLEIHLGEMKRAWAAMDSYVKSIDKSFQSALKLIEKDYVAYKRRRLD